MSHQCNAHSMDAIDHVSIYMYIYICIHGCKLYIYTFTYTYLPNRRDAPNTYNLCYYKSSQLYTLLDLHTASMCFLLNRYAYIIYTHVYMCMYAHTHTHTHTHIHTRIHRTSQLSIDNNTQKPSAKIQNLNQKSDFFLSQIFDFE